MFLRRLSLLLVPTCAAWLACGEAEAPAGEVNPPDVLWTDPREGTASVADGDLLPGCGEPDAGTGEVDAGTPDTSVLVTADSRFHTSTGVTVVPQDLSTRDLEILIPNPDGVGFERRSGTPVAGGMRFDDIPEGEFFVRSNHLHYLTRERRFDLGVNRVGRHDAVASSVSYSPAMADLTGLDPWQEYEHTGAPGSALQVVSGDVDLAASLDFSWMPPVGSTSYYDPEAFLTGFTGYPLPVLDPTKGDRVYVNQLNAVPSGTLPSGGPMAYTTVTSSQHLPAFAFTPDGTTAMPLFAALQPTAQNAFSMEWRLSEFTRWRADANPTSTLSASWFQVLPVPHGLQDGWVGYQGELLNLNLPRGETGVITRRLSFGNPYPASWGVLGLASYSFRSATPVVVGSRNHYPNGTISVIDRLDHLIAGPIQPRISPPQELRIDGLDAYEPRSVGSTQPVVSWQQPVLGTPRAYIVVLTRLTDSFNAQPTKRFYVPGNRNHLRLPASALEPGSTYYLRVTADGSPNYEPWRAPYVSSERLPLYSADTFSAAFTTP
ncbi:MULTISPECIES: fibronectin type III domain-containing protein [Corallococcus]|uniref:fibronectin type III domain-containing protein n=1 Tax=Corallococcus TaxID=83461 RepID=UPI0011C39A15|nr:MULTISPECIES: fibronectin type III domain-containing protein [Corallococcus]